MGTRGLIRRVAVRAGASLAALVLAAGAATAQGTSTPYQQDLDALCAFASEHYAYWGRRDGEPDRDRWRRACDALRPAAGRLPDVPALTHLLESLLAELADPHAFITSSNARSPRLVPTDADVLLGWDGAGATAHAVVRAVRAGSNAERAGVRVGQRVVAIDGLPPARAAATFEPRTLGEPPAIARDLALTQAAAGRQDGRPVTLSLQSADGAVGPATYVPGIARPGVPLSVEVLTAADGARIGWVRVHNALGDPALVPAWDTAIDALAGTAGLVLDLRDTPSGGDTTVARSLMGRLVDRPAPYQQHELAVEQRLHGVRRVWVEWLMPRGRAYGAPVAVLVGPWTGSMGEGTAIGLHAARGAPVIGHRMAGLLGGLGTITLANSRLQVKLPTEILRHVDGTPREDFRPCAVVPAVLVVQRGTPALRLADGRPASDPDLLSAATAIVRARTAGARVSGAAAPPGQGCSGGG